MANILSASSSSEAQTTAERIFRLIRSEMIAVEEEFERQVRTNIQIIAHIGRYLHQTGGKRVRPALLILSAKIFSEEIDQSIIGMATVMEFLHTATLVHDDIIDGAEMRRGRQAVSTQWGNNTAVLMGDWLYMTAYERALQQRNLDILDALTETTRKMTEGELIQLTLIGNMRLTEEQHLEIVSRKTGYLFSASCRVGAIMRGADEEQRQALADYGLNLGIAFQLVDDLLDFTSDSTKLGKPVLSDLREGKVTLPLIRLLKNHPDCAPTVRAAMEESPGETKRAEEVLALLAEYGELERARDEAYLYAARAQEALNIFSENKYRRALTDIAQFIVERDR
ncbi:MAG: polyprenyl synthetase family protein [Acidobacteria bacterium]|nr:polyprenyl synthetase family protein [Acidobacteriota bacterium]MCI0663235.1 polyprenyl synthetase family protein [Acidobacteriota bacterium]